MVSDDASTPVHIASTTAPLAAATIVRRKPVLVFRINVSPIP
jgi:hypothetical protein